MIIHGEYVVKRGLRLLMLPVLVVIFLFGWLLYMAGVPRGDVKKKSSKVAKPVVLSAAVEDDLEMRVIGELTEDPQIAS